MTVAPRELIPPVVSALRDVFGAELSAVTLSGSVLRGDWIPYFSDLDLKVFVPGMSESGPDPDQALALQERLGVLDPEEYQLAYVQLHFLDPDHGHNDLSVPPPGMFEVLVGSAPPVFAREWSTARYRDHARTSLGRIVSGTARLPATFADLPDRGLRRPVRLVGTMIKGGLLNVALLRDANPLATMDASLPELLNSVALSMGVADEARHFYAEASVWRDARVNPARLREMLRSGLRTLGAFRSCLLAASGDR